MTPEQKIRAKLVNELKRLLPKGRYLLQPIETNAVGVPDFYLAYNSKSVWIETKDLNYGLDQFQYNWQQNHTRSGGVTLLITSHVNPPKPTQTNPPTTAPQPHQQPQPHPPIPTHTPHKSSALYSVPYSKEMLNYSTLGAYLNAKRPVLTGLNEILQSLFIK